MPVEPSAYRHGVDPADMHHAIRLAVRFDDSADLGGAVFIIGPARDGSFLEVAYRALDNDELSIFHAMPARPRFLR